MDRLGRVVSHLATGTGMRIPVEGSGHGAMVPLQEQSIQEIINQQLLLQEQLRPLADGGVCWAKNGDRKHGEIMGD